MLNIHPKYIKTVRIRFFQRLVNGITGFINAFIGGIVHTIKSPLFGLQDFAIREVKVVDYEKINRDVERNRQQRKEQGTNGEDEEDDGGHMLHFKFSAPDEDEDWMKEHKKLYSDNDE